ncbi:MAG TPA: LLM class flavin-dependent oxidoreductase [Acidimicrobiales bacterium]|nr:LLM class flavin-dependent oxidoreductase [Acidimicrobiales bacterium]
MSDVTVGITPPIPPAADPETAAGVVRAVAEAGVDHLVVGDHVTFFGGFGVDGLIHATSLLTLHPHLPVHTSVYLLPLRHPVVVARQLSTLGSLAPGRLVLGVGIGGEDRHEISSCGVDPRTRGRRMDECLRILRELQGGGKVSFSGEFFDLDEVVVSPAPSPPVPVVVGGRSEAAVRRAGRLGDGWLGIWVSPRRFASAVRQAEHEAEAAGRSGVEWRHGMTVWCGFGDDAADGTAAVAPVMEGIYGLPFERFERYVPRGTPAQVADVLAGYAEVGCRSFNLLAQSGDRGRLADAAGEVRRRLSGRP